MSQHKVTKQNLSSPCHLTTLLSSSCSRNKDLTRSSGCLNTGKSFTEDTQHVLASRKSLASGKPNVSRANKNKHGNGADRKKVVS